MTHEEVRDFNNLIQRNAALFKELFGRGPLGPRYRVINGEQIRDHMPEIATYEEQRVRPITEEFAGEPLQPVGSSKRARRIQTYTNKYHRFRWHLDAQSYTVLLCLKNTNRGQTQVISQRMSQVLQFVLYPLYAVPQVFSIVPHQGITMAPGDLLLMRGRRVLHRGVTLDEEGERILMVYAYDEAGRKPNPLRDKIARALNY